MRLKLTTIHLLFVTLTWGQAKQEIKILYPEDWFGSIEKSDVHKENIYYGVYDLEDKYKYKQSCKVTSFHWADTLIDEPAYGLSRRLLIDSVKPIFIVSGIVLKNKSEISGINLNGLEIYPGKTVSYSNGQRQYVIYATGDYVKNKSELNPFSSIVNYQVTLRSVENNKIKEQTLYKADSLNAWPGGEFEGGVRIRWVGDLDNDKGIDIILSTSVDYRSLEVILLMTVNGKDKIVEEISRYSVSAP